MITQLIQAAIAHNVPVSFITGRLEAGASASRRDQSWELMKKPAPWRPYGHSEFATGRLVPAEALPCFDQEEVNTGTGKVLFTQQQHHRVCLRVPQQAPFDPAAYEHDHEVVLQALDLFAQWEAEGRLLRLLGTPCAYTTAGGGLGNNTAMTTQHMPLAVEDLASGDLLWVHPEAESIVNGARLGGGLANASPLPGSAPQRAPRAKKAPAPAPAAMPIPAASMPIPHATPAVPPRLAKDWLPELQKQVADLKIPEENRVAAMARIRARELQSLHPALSGAQALQQAEQEVTAALEESGAPTWLTELLAEAEQLGLTEHSKQVNYAISTRANILRGKGILPLEADSQSAQEVQEGLAALEKARKGKKAAKKPAATAANPSAEPEEKGSNAIPAEVLELKVHIDRKEITVRQVAKLISRSESVTSRYFSGTRGTSRGFDPDVLAQFQMISASLKLNAPLPAPLTATERKKAAPRKQPAGTPREKV